MKLFVLDTETGGLDPTVHSILSLALVTLDLESRTIGPSIEIKISEGVYIVNSEAMAINNIDLKEHSIDAKTPTGSINIIKQFLKGHRTPVNLVGHNVQFDIGFLKRLYRLADNKMVGNYGDLFSHRVVDTCSILRFLHHSGKVPIDVSSSDRAFAHFDIKIDKKDRHTALGDAMGTAQLYLKLLDV
jgi:DNA polymerase III subunit epsilon